jgi:hypothetical protein
MDIDFQDDPKPGDEIDVTIFDIVEHENDYGVSLKWYLTDRDNRTRLFFTPSTVTPRNRLGRTVVRLLGELKGFDTDTMVGMTATLVFASKKDNASEAIADLLKPRKPGKGEDPTADVAAAVEREAGYAGPSSAPF